MGMKLNVVATVLLGSSLLMSAVEAGVGKRPNSPTSMPTIENRIFTFSPTATRSPSGTRSPQTLSPSAAPVTSAPSEEPTVSPQPSVSDAPSDVPSSVPTPVGGPRAADIFAPDSTSQAVAASPTTWDGPNGLFTHGGNRGDTASAIAEVPPARPVNAPIVPAAPPVATVPEAMPNSPQEPLSSPFQNVVDTSSSAFSATNICAAPLACAVAVICLMG